MNGNTPSHNAIGIFSLRANRNPAKEISSAMTAPIFAIHEDRDSVPENSVNLQSCNLYLDSSAILTAYRFEFLDVLITSCPNVRIPHETIDIFMSLRQTVEILPNQTTKALKKILDSCESGNIEIVESASYIEDYTAIKTDNKEHKKLMLNGQVDNIAGILVNDENDLSINSEGLYNIHFFITDALLPTPTIDWPNKSAIFITMEALAILAENEITYESLIHRIPFKIMKAEYGKAKEIFNNNQKAQIQFNDITNLISTLREAITENKITVMSYTKQSDQECTLAYKGLLSLLEYIPEDGDLLWIDDRCVNKFSRRENGPKIISSWEILNTLTSHGLTIERFYKIIERMREANFRYIPISPQEIYYHLTQSGIDNMQMPTSPALKELKRYTSECLGQTEYVNKFTTTRGVVKYYQNVGRTCIETWDLIWGSRDSIEKKVQKSNWLITNLFLDPRSLSMISFGCAEHTPLILIITELLMTALQIDDSEEADKYLSWLYKIHLKPMHFAYPNIGPELARHIKRCIFTALDTEEKRKINLSSFHWLHRRLPTFIKIELEADHEYTSLMRMKIVGMISVCGVKIPWDDFEKAIEESLRANTPQKIRTDNSLIVEINASKDSNHQITIIVTTASTAFCIRDDLTQFWFNTPLQRKKALEENEKWLDVPPSKRQYEINRLSYLEPASNRMTNLEKLQLENLTGFYEDLHEKLLLNLQLHITDLFPQNVMAFINHIRIYDYHNFNLNDTLQLLFADELDRYAEIIGTIPIDLENCAYLKTAAPSLIKVLIKKLLSIRSPIAVIQLIKILDIASDVVSHRKLRGRILKTLKAATYLDEVESLRSILKWTENRVIAMCGKYSKSLQLAITWLHAGNLYKTLNSAGADVKAIEKLFTNADTLASTPILKSSITSENDCSSPYLTTTESILGTGLIYCLKETEISAWKPQIEPFIFLMYESSKFPRPEFLRLAWTSNCLNAFLAGSKLESTFGEEYEFLSSKDRSELIAGAIESIRTGNSGKFWWLILTFLIPRIHSDDQSVKQVLALIKAKGLLQCIMDSRSFLGPILTTILCVTRENQQIEELTRTLANVIACPEAKTKLFQNDDTRESDSVYGILIEAALQLSKEANEFDFERFGHIMLQFARANRDFARLANNFVTSFWDELRL